MRLDLDFAQARCNLAALLVQHGAIDQNAQMLHALQHRYQRLLDLIEQPPQRRDFLQASVQHQMQTQGDVGVFGSVLRRRVDRHVIE